jgi:hypothetical protein
VNFSCKISYLTRAGLEDTPKQKDQKPSKRHYTIGSASQQLPSIAYTTIASSFLLIISEFFILFYFGWFSGVASTELHLDLVSPPHVSNPHPPSRSSVNDNPFFSSYWDIQKNGTIRRRTGLDSTISGGGCS